MSLSSSSSSVSIFDDAFDSCSYCRPLPKALAPVIRPATEKSGGCNVLDTPLDSVVDDLVCFGVWDLEEIADEGAFILPGTLFLLLRAAALVCRKECKLMDGVGEGHEGPTLPGNSNNLAIWCIFLCLAFSLPFVNLCFAAMQRI